MAEKQICTNRLQIPVWMVGVEIWFSHKSHICLQTEHILCHL